MPLAQGCVQIYTGDGKGKTTAALGLLLRSAGWGLKVALIQFLKQRKTAELNLLEQLPGVSVYRFGTAGWVTGRPSKAAREQARQGLQQLRHCLVGRTFDCIIGDELCVAVHLGLLEEGEVLEVIALRPPQVELILTGRGASRGLRLAADLITEMKAVKHYYSRGVKARRGIEF